MSTSNPTHQILHLCSLGHLSQAATTLLSLPSPPLSATAALLHACARRRLLPLGLSIHRHLSNPLPLLLSNHLLNLYCQCSRPDLAQNLFVQMPHRNLVSYSTLLTSFSRQNLHRQCLTLFHSMLPFHLPNEFALTAALRSASKSHHSILGRQIHSLTFKTSFDIDVSVNNALILMYSTCNKSEDGGWLVFNEMPVRNVITWNSMIAGYPEWSFELFARMRKENVGFDRATMVSVAASFPGLSHCWQLHCVVIKWCFDSMVEVATALVKAYSRLGVGFGDCYKVFEGIREHDVMAWTGIITSCSEENPEAAMHLFCQLRRRGFEPDRFTLSIVVKASAGMATERHCSALHSLILQSGFGYDTVVCNALIHAYSRCGGIRLAKRAFEQMADRDQVSWNSMIKAYATHGRGREAMLAFERMDVPPDSATFVALLTACSHGGLIDEGRQLFNDMSQVYGVSPQLDHFACMVDVLGRGGLLSEAEELIGKMPMEPDSVVWSTLLGACRKHGEVEIAAKAAQKLMELQPKNSVGYVMMSNIYSAKGSFHDAASARKEMKECGVKKEPGLSWIEVRNRVHEFSAGGKRHPQIDAIDGELKQLVGRLKELGYVAETRLVLHEIEEEHKEERLLHHSEKLALVFGLMNAPSAQSPVRIMKNIRICEDCHEFIKLASKCVEKEIVVRDANRFHHFECGECSCGNFW